MRFVRMRPPCSGLRELERVIQDDGRHWIDLFCCDSVAGARCRFTCMAQESGSDRDTRGLLDESRGRAAENVAAELVHLNSCLSERDLIIGNEGAQKSLEVAHTVGMTGAGGEQVCLVAVAG